MPTRYSGFPSDQVRKLVLVRHGRTPWNLSRRAQGHTDIELDDVGHAEAERAAPYLAALRPSRLWSSDLARACQTAAYISGYTGLAVETDARLREYAVGERSGLTRAEFAERFPVEFAAWLRGDDSCLVPGAESTADVLARSVPALREFVSALSAGQTGIVVMHGACLRVSMLTLLGLPPEAEAAFATMGNCTWTSLQEDAPGGRLRLLTYNEGVPDHDFASEEEVG
jgi:probable phosphoglycerate mutase